MLNSLSLVLWKIAILSICVESHISMSFGWHSGFGEKWQRKQLALSFEKKKKESENVSLYAVNSSFICSYITLSGFSIVLVENVWLKYKEAFTHSKDFPFNLIGALPAYAIPNMLGSTTSSPKRTTWALRVISLLKSPSMPILQDRFEAGRGV